MATVKFSKQTAPPSGEALMQELQKALEKTLPLDDFIQIVRDLAQLENQYKLNSSEFYTDFQQGKLDDSIDFIRWANKYEIYQEIVE